MDAGAVCRRGGDGVTQLELWPPPDKAAPAAYLRGFVAGFEARADAEPPQELEGLEREGWIEGRDGIEVPAWRLQ